MNSGVDSALAASRPTEVPRSGLLGGLHVITDPVTNPVGDAIDPLDPIV